MASVKSVTKPLPNPTRPGAPKKPSNSKLQKEVKRFRGVFDAIEYTGDAEKDAAAELDAMRDMLMSCTETPPNTGDIRDSPHGFCVCFEGRSQKNKFLTDIGMMKFADKYMDGYALAEMIGLDMDKGTFDPESGTMNVAGLGSGRKALAFGANKMKFGQLDKGKMPPKEIGEVLTSIRADEKQLAKYMDWVIDAEYWIWLEFWTQDEADKFLAIMGLKADAGWNRPYVWCHDFADKIGIALEPCVFKDRAFSGKEDPKLCSLVKELLDDLRQL